MLYAINDSVVALIADKVITPDSNSDLNLPYFLARPSFGRCIGLGVFEYNSQVLYYIKIAIKKMIYSSYIDSLSRLFCTCMVFFNKKNFLLFHQGIYVPLMLTTVLL